MRLELLKVGDWVRNAQTGEYIQVTIETFRNHHNYEIGETSTINLNMLEPIKLTEVLGTCSFVSTGENIFNLKESPVIIELKNKKAYVTIPDVITGTVIFYVHQLQQLFRNTGLGYISAKLKL